MKTARKINKEGQKKDQLKRTHAQTKNRPIKHKNKINSNKTKQKQAKQTSKGEQGKKNTKINK